MKQSLALPYWESTGALGFSVDGLVAGLAEPAPYSMIVLDVLYRPAVIHRTAEH